jgi:hypothetical protein
MSALVVIVLAAFHGNLYLNPAVQVCAPLIIALNFQYSRPYFGICAPQEIRAYSQRVSSFVTKAPWKHRLFSPNTSDEELGLYMDQIVSFMQLATELQDQRIDVSKIPAKFMRLVPPRNPFQELAEKQLKEL